MTSTNLLKRLDIDRLHATIEQLKTTEHLPRRAGKTTAQLVLLLGEMEVGESNTNHLVVGPTTSYVLRLCEQFCDMLTEAEVPFQRSRHRNSIKTDRNQTVTFVGCQDVHNHVRGVRLSTVTYDIPPDFNGIPGHLREYIQSFMEEFPNVTDERCNNS